MSTKEDRLKDKPITLVGWVLRHVIIAPISAKYWNILFVCLIGLIHYVQSPVFQLWHDGSSWVEPVLSRG